VGACYPARPGCPSVPEVACLDQTGNAVWFLAGSSSRQPSIAATFRYAASMEVHLHSPVPSFPHPVRRDGSGSPWALPVCCRTPRYRGACAGREPTWALVGAVVTRHGPLIWSDFVSHGPYGILAAQAPEISAGIRPSRRQTCRARRRRLPPQPASLSRYRPHPVPSGVGIALGLPPQLPVLPCAGVICDPGMITSLAKGAASHWRFLP
jgi:hypothetical protein